MNKDAQEKLKHLLEKYRENLPEKAHELEKDIHELEANWNNEKLIEIHRKVHSLHGSAGSYGFEEIAKIAAEVEAYLENILQLKNLSSKNLKKTQSHINNLTHTINEAKTSHPINKVDDRNVTTQRSLYIFSNNRSLYEPISSQLPSFGFNISILSNLDQLIEKLNKTPCCIVLVDINLLDNNLYQHLLSEKNKYELGARLLFFMGDIINYEKRIQIIRAGSKGYFTKPIYIEELIKVIEHYQSYNTDIYRILIVDDDAQSNALYKETFKNAGILAKAIVNPSIIENEIEAFRPDLILVDIYMSEYSGIDIASLIRQQSAYEYLPIIFFSSEMDKSKQLQAMQCGADDFIVKSFDHVYLIEAIKNRIRRYRTLGLQMMNDGLTSVFNHSTSLQRLEMEYKLASRLKTSLSVVMIDLDFFKNINDTYGHPAGDQVLKTMSLAFRKRIRKTDIMGRWGGEEFVLILPNTTQEDAFLIVDNLRKQFADITFSKNKIIFSVTFSAGIAQLSEDDNTSTLIKKADEALYQSKVSGRNTVTIFKPKPEMNTWRLHE